jgi:hypothetical protein
MRAMNVAKPRVPVRARVSLKPSGCVRAIKGVATRADLRAIVHLNIGDQVSNAGHASAETQLLCAGQRRVEIHGGLAGHV